MYYNLRSVPLPAIFLRSTVGQAFEWLSSIKPIQQYSNTKLIKYYINQAPFPERAEGDTYGDRYARHLPEDKEFNKRIAEKVPLEKVLNLFTREGKAKPGRSSLLFPWLAQFLTDGVFASRDGNFEEVYANHQMDLSPVYGLDNDDEMALRSGEGGRLKVTQTKYGDMPDKLYEQNENGGWVVKKCYAESLEWAKRDKQALKHAGLDPSSQSPEEIFATGLPVSNQTVGNVAFTTLFLREHNRIADALKAKYLEGKSKTEIAEITGGQAEDDWLFDKARQINNTIFIKLIIEEYINHVAGRKAFVLNPFKALEDNEALKGIDYAYLKNIFEIQKLEGIEKTQKEDRRFPVGVPLTIEFNLIYRWHSLIVDAFFKVAGQAEGLINNNKIFREFSLSSIFAGASATAASTISLKNTNMDIFNRVEMATINKARKANLGSYNDYREHFGLERLTSFEDLTNDRELIKELKDTYGHIDNLELLPGIYAEKPERSWIDWLFPRGRVLVGSLLETMVAHDAFVHAMTNPYLSPEQFNKDVTTPLGMRMIKTTKSVQDLLKRNDPEHYNKQRISLDREGYSKFLGVMPTLRAA